ncbi:hypothetical protein, partial [Enterococcus casseliflavus]|uniref:hypothetical protein n=1 Tax=Enterococcus casseliflavus TaxID=37734 RepID=UPI003D14B96D
GVNAIEDGLTDVCGIAPESALARFGFDFDALVNSCEPLAERLKPLRRRMDWLAVGPLAYRSPGAGKPQPEVYPAGDALGFV